MGVNHRRSAIPVAQQLLDSPDVIAICSRLKVYARILSVAQIRTLPGRAPCFSAQKYTLLKEGRGKQRPYKFAIRNQRDCHAVVGRSQ